MYYNKHERIVNERDSKSASTGWGVFMGEVFYIFGGWLLLLFVLLYWMLVTRRTVLRVIGWVAATSLFILCLSASSHDSGVSYTAVSTMVINDLRNLRGAAFLFCGDHEIWPSPGQEASLDAYCDRPIVNASHARYARVTLYARPLGEAGSVDLYVGVELLPERNGAPEVQRKLARRARDSGIFQEPTSGGGELVPYESGLSVYMKIN
jgi:hypothetical protein